MEAGRGWNCLSPAYLNHRQEMLSRSTEMTGVRVVPAWSSLWNTLPQQPHTAVITFTTQSWLQGSTGLPFN